MIRQQLRRLCSAVLVASLVLGVVDATAAAAGGDPDEPTITFFGGGFGHGIGMSQYGAYGRAVAGQSYEEILAHYYAGTTIDSVDGYGPFSADTPDGIDVLIDIRSSVTVSPPIENGSPQAGWEIAIEADGVQIATSTTPVTATYSGGHWSALAGGADLCDDRCTSAVLSMSVVPGQGGTHVVLEEFENGPNIGNPSEGRQGAYARGRIVLQPAALGGGCGTGNQFCVIHGDLDLQDYVRGIAEIPRSWPLAAQRAQAVAARSYAVSAVIRRADNGLAFDLYDSTQDQYYAGYFDESACGNWCDAVADTDNEVVVYDGEVAETFYSASNGGYSAEPPDVWASGTTRPYLRAEPDEFDGNDANPYAAKEYVYTLADVSRWLNQYIDPITGDQLHVGTIRSIEIDAPPSGRVTFANISIVGSEKSTQVENWLADGSVTEGPYGFRFYAAIRQGCLADKAAGADCDPLRSTNFSVQSVISFADVLYDDYFYRPVQWMTVEGITTGVSPGVFGSDDSSTRAQVATFLWRFAGEPVPGSPSGFGDVVEASYYEDAVSWMKERGITTGTTPTEFSPGQTVTRAQAATFLWRFAGSPATTAEISFADVDGDRFYTEAVRWMVEWGITTGTTPTTFSPDDPLTRAQIATFLWRLAGTPGAFADGATLPGAMRTS